MIGMCVLESIVSEIVSIPKMALRRLPKYLSYLRRLNNDGKEFVSASKIGEVLDVQHTQVRKDIALTGAQGVPKRGHKVKELIKKIEEFLGWDNTEDAFLVGAGNIGKALVGYSGFSEKGGIRIVSVFESDNRKVGQSINGIKVLPISKLVNLLKRMKIKIGIIATPASVAQEVADQLIAGGALAIWNFAPIHLDVPEGIIVENFDMYSSLGALSRKLKERISS